MHHDYSETPKNIQIGAKHLDLSILSSEASDFSAKSRGLYNGCSCEIYESIDLCLDWILSIGPALSCLYDSARPITSINSMNPFPEHVRANIACQRIH